MPPGSADFSPQEATLAQGRSCGLKPALLTDSWSPCAPDLPASRLSMNGRPGPPASAGETVPDSTCCRLKPALPGGSWPSRMG